MSQYPPPAEQQLPPGSPLALEYATPTEPRVDLRRIAIWQCATTWSILAYMILIASLAALFNESDEIRRGHMVITAAAVLAFDACAVMLSLSVYRSAAGAIGAILTVVPLFGLFILVLINADATRILRRHGVRIGLTGAANLRDVPPLGQPPTP
jgi:hypothetical protein